MTFTRYQPLGFALYEVLPSAAANQWDRDIARSVDGYAGGTYTPSGQLTWNNQITIDATLGAGAQLVGLTVTGKGPKDGTGGYFTGGNGAVAISADGSIGVSSVGGDADTDGNGGAGVSAIGGDGNGIGVGGYGGYFIAGANNGSGVYGLAKGNGTGGVFYGAGTGYGINATGGATGGPGGYFTGGTSNGYGLQAYGLGSGIGVYGQGGPTNGVGVRGLGIGEGSGILGLGTGGSVPTAVYAHGAGVVGAGGTNAAGGFFEGNNYHGVYGYGNGVGVGVFAMGATNTAPLRLDPRGTDPSTLADGDVWVTATEMKVRIGGATKTVLVA